MRFTTTLLLLSLSTLGACGCGADPSQADVFQLVQAGKYEAAIIAAEAQLAGVDKGSDAHLDLAIKYAAALAKDHGEDARDRFLAFAQEHPRLVQPRDFKYVVSRLRKHDRLLEAIDVMDSGRKRWPGDPTMEEVLVELQQQVSNSGNTEAAKKLKGLGYV